jgi:hypothetical protein
MVWNLEMHLFLILSFNFNQFCLFLQLLHGAMNITKVHKCKDIPQVKSQSQSINTRTIITSASTEGKNKFKCTIASYINRFILSVVLGQVEIQQILEICIAIIGLTSSIKMSATKTLSFEHT